MNELTTAHGVLMLPAFLPDATRAVARTVDSRDLEGIGVEALMVNALHLSSRPGASVVSSLGGVHRFMGWQGVVASDSGGYQVYSLAAKSGPRRCPHHAAGMGSVSERGFTYRLARGARKETLTPEKCIGKQLRLGADIMFCLDYCTHPDAPADIQRESVDRTVAWARRCKDEFRKRLVLRSELLRRVASVSLSSSPLLFAVVQGGGDRDLRRRCAEELLEIGFDGYAYGGWPVDSKGRLVDTVEYVRELVPRGFPLHALGIGKPESVVRCAALGYDLFDCTLPTRDARHGRLYVSGDGFASAGQDGGGSSKGGRFYECLRILDERHRRDGRPLEEGCDCPACCSYSRAYLRHLFEIRDPAGQRLATLHNLRFYARLMERLRSQAG